MRAVLRKFSIGTGRGNGLGLALVLLLVVLVPSICLWWFMTQAVRNERLAVRQKLIDAYRAHLALAQEHLVSDWKQKAEDLEDESGKIGAPALFARQVRKGFAEAVICFDNTGNRLYPTVAATPKPEALDARWLEAQGLERSDPAAAAVRYARLASVETNTDLSARALQNQARSLLHAGQREAAVLVLGQLVADDRFKRSTDQQGRLLVPNAQLTSFELTKETTNGPVGATLKRLQETLAEYENSTMSSPQRRFLMREVQRFDPDEGQFPTLAAEDLAALYVEGAPEAVKVPGLRPTSLPGIWKFTSGHGLVITLHKTESLIKRMRTAASTQILPADARLDFFAPGQESDKALFSSPVGDSFPGWRIGLSLSDQQIFQTASQQRVTGYLWIGVLVIATVVILGSLALGMARRQMTLTQLRNDLVANVTHELKTPLSSMRLLVETLVESKTLNEHTTREYLQLISRENARLSRLIDNFLTFSRMERNRYAFGFKEVSATTIVEAASAAVQERLSVAGCKYSVEIAPNLPLVLADADAIATVLVNLLDNAFKYSGEEKQIGLSVGTENGQVVFAVTDNGIGLAVRETKRIFKRFYRVDQRMSRTDSGCGLGLSIVQFIVKAHQGTVHVQSQPGRGSEFIVRLPAMSKQVESQLSSHAVKEGGVT